MVKAIINIDDHTNRVLNIVKARFGLNDKSEAIEAMAAQYEEELMEPQIRPEYIEKLRKIRKEKTIKIGSSDDFAKKYGLK